MPDIEIFDFDRFEVGGCCVTGDDPEYKCVNCEYSWQMQFYIDYLAEKRRLGT